MEKYLTNSHGATLSKQNIQESVKRLQLYRAVVPGQVIKVAFLDSAPDYSAPDNSTTSLASYLTRYRPDINPSTRLAELDDRTADAFKAAVLAETTFRPVPSAQRQEVFDRAIKLWQDTYADVRFELVSDPTTADVRVGISGGVSVNLAPGALPDKPVLGDVYLEASVVRNGDAMLRDHALTTLFHEFGHVLGLTHGDDAGQLPAEYGKMKYEVMNARDAVGMSFAPQTPMLFDAVGLQAMGLLKTNLNTDSYSAWKLPRPGTGLLVIDNGGIHDVLDASDTTTNNEIDLRAADFAAGKAYFSSIGMDRSNGDRYNVAIYEGSVIEDAVGGSGRDHIIGNAEANNLNGGKGDDRLEGGVGVDVYTFDSRWGSDTINDSDGQGQIKVDVPGVAIDGSNTVKLPTGVWQTRDKQIIYRLAKVDDSRSDLYITVAGRKDQTIHIENWSPQANLGINLPGQTASLDDTLIQLIGDFAKKQSGGDYLLASSDNSLNYVSAGPQPGADDVINGGDADERIVGLGGNDGLSGGDGDDLLEGGDGDDLLFGGTGSDTLNGGDGNDYIFGSATGHIDTPRAVGFTPPRLSANGIEAARGFSWVVERPRGPRQDGDDTHLLGAGVHGADASPGFWGPDGSVWVEATGNLIDAGAGDDYVAAGTADDTVHGGDGNDDIYGLGGADLLYGDDGNDILVGDGYPDLDAGTVTPPEEHGADILIGGGGADVLIGQGDNDQLFGGAGNDWLWGDDDDLNGTPLSFHGNDYLDGGDGNDRLEGGGRDDRLMGGAGNDKLWGDNSAQNIISSDYEGKDYLDGGAGDDELTGGGSDDELLGGDGDDLLWGDAEFAGRDGATAWTTVFTQGRDLLDGGAGDDQLMGGGNDDALFGGSGDDVLFGDDDGTHLTAGEQGNDYLDGEEGNDVLLAGGGDDVLIGGDGNDMLLGGAGDDQLDGGDGNDGLNGGAGDDVLDGGAGFNALLGGDGNDTLLSDGGDYLDGGAGDDVYRIAAGVAQVASLVDDAAGANTLFVEGAEVDASRVFVQNGQTYLSTGGASSLVSLGSHAVLGGLRLRTGAGSDTGADASPSPTVQQILDSASPGGMIRSGTWAAGVGLTYTRDISTAQTIVGGDRADWLEGGSGVDAIDGGAGADLIEGGAGADTLVGGTGADRLRGGAGDDTLFAGTSAASENDAEVDEYLFARGDGVDLIRAGTMPAAAARDVIRFDAGISRTDIHVSALFSSNGPDAKASLSIGYGAADRIVLKAGAEAQIDRIAFADGSTMGMAELLALVPAPASGPVATEGDDVIVGTPGDDRLEGRGGNDTLTGGSGDDILTGGSGRNTYRFDLHSGHDTLMMTAGERGLLVFEGVEPSTIAARVYNNDLVLQAGDSVVQVNGYGSLATASNGWQVEGASGERVSVESLLAAAAPAPGGWDALPARRQHFLDNQFTEIRTLPERWFNWTPVVPKNVTKADLSVTADGSSTLPSYVSESAVPFEQTSQSLRPIYQQTERQPTRLLEFIPLPGVQPDFMPYGAIPVFSPPGDQQLTLGGDARDVIPQPRFEGYWITDAGAPPELRIVGYETVVQTVTVMRAADTATQMNVHGTADADVITGSKFRGSIDTGDGDDSISFFPVPNGLPWTHADWIAASFEQQPFPFTDYRERGLGAWIDAGAGNDTVLGTEGHDIIRGGTGSDRLDGAAGSDTYLIERESGSVDRISDLAASADPATDFYLQVYGGTVTRVNEDSVEFDGSVDISAMSFRWTASTEAGSFGGGGYQTLDLLQDGEVFLQIDYSADAARRGQAGAAGIERFVFADGTSLTLAQLLSALSSGPAAGGNGGGPGDGHGGGGGGGDAGGSVGVAQLWGTAADDYLPGDAGAEHLHGEDGNDVLVGGAGDDILDGGAGNDTLDGGEGADVYLFGRGSGHDTITNYDSDGPASRDVVRLGDGIAPSDLHIRFDGYAAVLTLDGTDDSLTLPGFLNEQIAIDAIEFADGTVWDRAAIRAQFLIGSDAGEQITGYEGADLLDGRGGDDALQGGAGDDTLLGAAGQDALDGGAGNDTLDGGTGDDRLSGGDGADVYRFGRGGGHDTIDNYDNDGAASADVIRLDAGVAPSDVRLTFDGYTATLGIEGSADTLRLPGFANEQIAISAIEFADGTVWDRDAIKAQFLLGGDADDRITGYNGADRLEGRAGNDWLSGGAGDDTLLGGTGADWLQGDAGNDVLDGGAGDDELRGGDGDDTYRFGRGGGHDRVLDDGGAADAIAFAPGIDVDDLWFRRSGADLEISVVGSGDQIVVGNWYSVAAHRVESLRTADGHVLADGSVQNLVDAMAAFAPPAAGQTELPPAYRDTLAATLVASWQPPPGP